MDWPSDHVNSTCMDPGQFHYQGPDARHLNKPITNGQMRAIRANPLPTTETKAAATGAAASAAVEEGSSIIKNGPTVREAVPEGDSDGTPSASAATKSSGGSGGWRHRQIFAAGCVSPASSNSTFHACFIVSVRGDTSHGDLTVLLATVAPVLSPPAPPHPPAPPPPSLPHPSCRGRRHCSVVFA